MTATLNNLGHRLGEKGARTRTALLEALRARLDASGPDTVRVADVAAAAGLRTSNFYTYFSDLDAAVLVLVEDCATAFQPLAARLDGDWSSDRALDLARGYIAAVLDLWRRHGAVLRIEHFRADQGRAAFVEARVRRLRRIHLAFERRIAQTAATGRHPSGLDPRLASYEAASLVESVASGLDLMRRGDTPDRAIVDTTAHILVRMVTGR